MTLSIGDVKNMVLEAANRGEALHLTTEATSILAHLFLQTSVQSIEGQTLGDILENEGIGGWLHRTDIEDSIAYADALRAQAERRD